ncbi:hypothetical protein Tco_0781421, partial [Tanacetum coccineum]
DDQCPKQAKDVNPTQVSDDGFVEVTRYNDVGSIMDDSDSEKVKNVFMEDNGKPRNDLVDDARDKVKAPPKKTPRKTCIWKVVEDMGEDEDFKVRSWVSAVEFVNANEGIGMDVWEILRTISRMGNLIKVFPKDTDPGNRSGVGGSGMLDEEEIIRMLEEEEMTELELKAYLGLLSLPALVALGNMNFSIGASGALRKSTYHVMAIFLYPLEVKGFEVETFKVFEVEYFDFETLEVEAFDFEVFKVKAFDFEALQVEAFDFQAFEADAVDLEKLYSGISLSVESSYHFNKLFDGPLLEAMLTGTYFSLESSSSLKTSSSLETSSSLDILITSTKHNIQCNIPNDNKYNNAT